MADFEERMKMLVNGDHISGGDTFAERAEWFFSKRPHLIALLKDLYNAYITLLDRCDHPRTQSTDSCDGESSVITLLDRCDHRRAQSTDSYDGESSLISLLHCCDHPTQSTDSCDGESSVISYQQPPTTTTTITSKFEQNEIVAHLVMKNVEEDILVQQLSEMEQQCHESSTKIELLKKLLQVLESERMVLLNENERLGHEMERLVEENMFLNRKASQLARCFLKMREDHKACMLTRKIEHLQTQIYGLEMRNNEYYHQLLNKEKQQHTNNAQVEVAFMGCFQFKPKWWERVKKGLVINCYSPTSKQCF